MSKDIIYCGYSNCKNTDCESHAIHSTYTDDSFAYFDSCPTHQKALEDLRSAIADIED